MNLIRSYWQQSKSPFYSLIFTIPLLITYEVMIFSFNHSDIIGLRNGADVLFRQFFAVFNIYGFYLVGFLVLSDFGEVFEVKSFLVRFGAGIFLSALYTLRGYGITAYTHTFYDLIVIIL